MRTLLSLFALILLAAPCRAQSSELNEAEQAFADLMSGAVMVGRFSVDGRETPPKEERYEISKAQKLGGDKWLITARIKYGQNDIEVPVAVQMNWAGDTPVLSVTDIAIPGLGEGFTTRLLFYRDRYAGSWYHGEAGGHMWGKIEKAEESDDKVSRNDLDPEDRRVKQQLEERVNAKFDEAKLPEVVEYLSNATGITITVSPDVLEVFLTDYSVRFESPRPPRLGHLLPRILRPVGLVPLIVDGGIEIHPAGTKGVLAVSDTKDATVQRALKETADLKFDELPLEKIVELVSDKHSVDIDILSGIDRRFAYTFAVQNVPLQEALNQMLADDGLKAVADQGCILIRHQKDVPFRMMRALGNRTRVECVDFPLIGLAEYLGSRHNITVTLGPGVDPDMPINFESRDSLRQALRMMLASHDLKPVVSGSAIEIRKRSED